MPTTPAAREVVVIASAAGAGGAIVIVSAADFVRAGVLESVTVTVTGLAVTAAVGVPEITPVAAATDNPAGSPVIDQL